MGSATALLRRIGEGDAAASEALLPLVYEELRELARAQLRTERPGHTLQATALVHEAYVRLVRDDSTHADWHDEAHFFGAAAEAMRRILVEHARKKNRLKRGGEWTRVPLGADLLSNESHRLQQPEYMLALNVALEKLARIDPTAVELVELRYFAGLTVAQTADALGISIRTANRVWGFARAWLFDELSRTES